MERKERGVKSIRSLLDSRGSRPSGWEVAAARTVLCRRQPSVPPMLTAAFIHSLHSISLPRSSPLLIAGHSARSLAAASKMTYALFAAGQESGQL